MILYFIFLFSPPPKNFLLVCPILFKLRLKPIYIFQAWTLSYAIKILPWKYFISSFWVKNQTQMKSKSKMRKLRNGRLGKKRKGGEEDLKVWSRPFMNHFHNRFQFYFQFFKFKFILILFFFEFSKWHNFLNASICAIEW